MHRKGFTLIELLIVVVIIGILAAIAIPKFASTKDLAKLGAIKSDLRNLETAQEAYFSNNSTYGTYAQLGTGINFVLTAGNMQTAEAASAGGYSMTIANSSISGPTTSCHVAVGVGAPVGQDGVISCP